MHLHTLLMLALMLMLPQLCSCSRFNQLLYQLTEERAPALSAPSPATAAAATAAAAKSDSRPSYNSSLSYAAAVLSSAAYYVSPSDYWLKKKSLSKRYGQLANVTRVTISCDTMGSRCSAFVGRLPSAGITVLSFRGTHSPFQLMVESLKGMTEPKRPVKVGGRVQDYFYRTQQAIWAQLRRHALRVLNASSSDRVLVTGHSLGGAIATLTACELAAKMPHRWLTLLTFGEPRVGDREFAMAADALIKDSWRVVHFRDPVVHLPSCNGWKKKCNPKKLESPYHKGTEVFYADEDMPPETKNFRICRGKPHHEDITCANNRRIWLVCLINIKHCNKNHKDYFGVVMHN